MFLGVPCACGDEEGRRCKMFAKEGRMCNMFAKEGRSDSYRGLDLRHSIEVNS